MPATLRQIRATSTDGTAAGNLALAFSSPVLAGSTIVAFVGHDFSTTTVSNCGDSVNGASTYSLVASSRGDDTLNSQRIEAWLLKVSAAGTPTVTANYSGSAAWRSLIIAEITNDDASTPVNIVAAGGPAASTTPAVAIAPTVDNCYILAGVTQNDVAQDLPGSSGSFTNRTGFGNVGTLVSGANDFTQSAHASVNAQFSFTNADHTSISVLAIAPAPSAQAPRLFTGFHPPLKVKGPVAMVMRQLMTRQLATTAGTTFTQSCDGGITPVGDLVKQTTKTLSGGMTPAGDLVKQTLRALTGGITPSGALTKQTQKPLSGGITPAGALAAVKTALLSLAGAITPTGALTKQTQKPLGGGITPAGTLTKQVARPVGGTITPSGTLTKQTQKPLGGGLTPSGVLAAIKTALLSIGGTITPSGDVTTNKIATPPPASGASWTSDLRQRWPFRRFL